MALTVLKWGTIAGVAGMAVAATALALIFWIYGRDPTLHNLQSLADYKPKQVTRIAAADGTIIGEFYTERRTYIPFEEVPEVVIKAFVAAEDADFFEHQGLDYWGMVRALYINLRERKKKQGASTITQQVVKTFLLSRDKRVKRKIQEIILARRLEAALSKEEILSLYLNQIYFGHGRYGLREAAQFYFGKHVKDLNPGEAAMLAGLPQGPEILSPKKPKNRERAKRRQQYVLEQMAHLGYLTEAEAKKWIDDPIRIVRDPFPEMGTAPEWVLAARRELLAQHGEEDMDSLGARVVTTMDRTVQAAAFRALRKGLREYDKRHKYGQVVRKVKPDKVGLEVAKLARKLPKGGPKRGEHYLAVIREVHDSDAELVVDLGKWVASVKLDRPGDERYMPTDQKTGQPKRPSERFAIGDLIRVRLATPGKEKDRSAPLHSGRTVEFARGPQGAVVVIEPSTRRVLAMVGGYSSRVGDFNRARQAKRQPGSSFKPIVYTAAIDSEKYTAASLITDAPEVYDLWKPQNYQKGQFQGKVRLRHALARSTNTVAIRVLHEVGIEPVIELARAMGISSELPAELSLALGSGEVTPLELGNAFATLAARGAFASPQFVRSVDGQEVAAPPTEQALSPQVAYVVLDMMTSVVNEGTAQAARNLKMPVAGKTGTSNDARDAWFIGMTPNYVAAVWIGFDDNRPLGRGESGSRTALPVYIELMKQIGKDERNRKFTVPEGVNKVLVDRATGLLAPREARDEDVYTEVFIAGTEPTETALAPGEAAASSFIEDEYDDYEEDGESTEPAAGGGQDAFPPEKPSVDARSAQPGPARPRTGVKPDRAAGE
ncbi:MAG: PBP1A family penicillin-binding protein [Proteobacteria bacterium]|nr:PBP1A family penicillin-binding protein [Pseudomonadota bacterium]